jgi:predicted HicB family RNase H-like nuclease
MRNVIEIDGHRAVVSFPTWGSSGANSWVCGGHGFLRRERQDAGDGGQKVSRRLSRLLPRKSVEPFRAFSGKFNVRLDPKMHEKAVIAAVAENKS